MAPSRGRETPRLDKGDAAALERTAQEQKDREATEQEKYWEQVWRRLGLPEEDESEETEDEYEIRELSYEELERHQGHNGWWPEEEEQTAGQSTEGNKESGGTSAHRKAKKRQRRKKKRRRRTTSIREEQGPGVRDGSKRNLEDARREREEKDRVEREKR